MTAIKESVCRLEIGKPIVVKNLTMFPLQAEDISRGDYLTLDEALAQKLVRITEMDQSGSVPELLFVNDADNQVLLMDGEELVGAKQNRTLNITILADAHSTLTLPVTCVEAGRWSHTSPEFASASRSHYAAGRARKQAHVSESLVARGSHSADQSDVWQDISAKAARMASPSPTQAMAAMYELHETDVETFVEGLAAQSRQLGAVFAINSEIIGCDLFECAATLTKLLPKIVRSYALDAVDRSYQSTGGPAAATGEVAAAFLKSISESEVTLFPAVGLGEDARLQAPGLAGGALLVDGRVVHLTAFTSPKTAAANSAPMSRAAARRRHWQQSE